MRGAVLSFLLLVGCGRIGYGPNGGNDGGSGDGGGPADAGTVDALIAGDAALPDARLPDATFAPGDLATGVAVDLAAGSDHSCVVLEGGEVACWGRNDDGQLGDGTMTSRTSPQRAMTMIDGPAVSVTAGADFTCLRAERVFCWGNNASGQLGDGSTVPRSTPGATAPLEPPIDEVAAGARFACARAGGGEVFCWGDNASGQLGIGSMGGFEPMPNRVDGLPTAAVDISAGAAHACAALSNGALHCWGENETGQLGGGVGPPRPTPGPAPVDDIVAAAAGGGHTCSLQRNGAVRCWGGNELSQSGVAGARLVEMPVMIALSGQTVDLEAGRANSCTVNGMGDCVCWGDLAYGQWGNGNAGGHSSGAAGPREIPDSVQVAVGFGHVCSRSQTGAVHCWGKNDWGQVSGEPTLRELYPVTVPALP